MDEIFVGYINVGFGWFWIINLKFNEIFISYVWI